jgi:hypothetical protein
MKKLAILFLAASIAAPAAAADPATAGAATVAAAPVKAEKPKKEKKICRSFSTSESRLGSAVCKTAAEWAKQEGDPLVGGRTRVNKVDN